MTKQLNIQRHIATLCRHKAQLRASNGKTQPFTRAFYNQALFECATRGYAALVYDMILPDVPEPLQLVIWRSGHIDSGSPQSIGALLGTKGNVGNGGA